MNQRSATTVASGPRSSHFWSGDSSHTPQARRTASCSRIASPKPATQLQPSHSANSAPSARCTESNAVAVSVCSPSPTGRPVYASGPVGHNTTRATYWTTSRTPPGGGRTCDARARRLSRVPVRGRHERAVAADRHQRQHRVAAALDPCRTAGYVEHVPETGRYRLGPHLLQLANHVLRALDLRARHAAPRGAGGGDRRDRHPLDSRSSAKRSPSTSWPAAPVSPAWPGWAGPASHTPRPPAR